jgi:hypothetical protein
MILYDQGRDEQSASLSYQEARLFNQFARHMREYLGQALQLGRVLNISSAAKPDAGTKDILPADVGVNKHGEGERWTVSRLKDEGLRAAQEAGIANPTADQIASYGLYQAARQNPLNESDPAKIEALIRLAFFSYGSGNVRVDPTAVEYVASQVRASLVDHLDDTTGHFNRWIEDRRSNLVSRIAKRKLCKWNREEVRAALVELGWRSFKSLSQCVDVFFRSFEAALPERLNVSEKKLFSQIYRSRPSLGSIPLLLLHERFDFLKPAILDTWNNPGSRRAVGILLRMIWYYAELVANRRAADRVYKQRAGSREEWGGIPLDQMFVDDDGHLRPASRKATEDPGSSDCL